MAYLFHRKYSNKVETIMRTVKMLIYEGNIYHFGDPCQYNLLSCNWFEYGQHLLLFVISV